MNFENINNFSELPLTLNVVDIAKILGLSKQNAYSLCHNENFPCVTVGRRMIIPKLAFVKWMENPSIKERWA